MADMFWDVRHHTDSPIQDSVTRRAEHEVADLLGRVDRLSMICCAMWTILQSRLDTTDEELAQLVEELDLSDGASDGRCQVAQVRPCSACQRPVSNRHHRCLYCGAPRRDTTPFDAIM